MKRRSAGRRSRGPEARAPKAFLHPPGAESLSYGAVLLVAFLVPVVFSRGTLYSDAIKTVVFECLALPAFWLWIAHVLAQGSWRVPDPKALGAILCYWAVNAVSYLFSPYKTDGREALWRLSLFLLFAFLVSLLVVSAKRQRGLVYSLLAASLLVGGYGLLQRLGLDPVSWSVWMADLKPGYARVFSSLGNPNMLAGYCVLAIPVLAMAAVPPGPRAFRALACFAALLLAVVLLFTRSRGGMLGFAGAMAFLGFWNRPALAAWIRGHRGIAALLCASLLLGGGLLARPLWPRFERLLSSAEGGEEPADLRLLIWPGTVRIFLDHPVLGAGPGSFQDVFPEYRGREAIRRGLSNNILHAHSEYLELLAETGLVGLVAFLSLVGLAFSRGLGPYPAAPPAERGYLVGLLAGVFGLLVQNLVSVNLRWPACAVCFWLFLGAVLGTARSGRAREIAIPRFLQGRAARYSLLFALGAGFLFLAHEKAIRPYRAELLFLRATRLHVAVRYEEASRLFEEVIRLRPTHKIALYDLAYCFTRMKQYDRAEEAYKRLQGLSPHYSHVHYNLFVTYYNRQMWPEALEEYRLQKWLGGMPEVDLEPLFQGVASVSPDEGERLVKALEEVAEYDPGDGALQNRLGNLYLGRKEPGKARARFETVLRRDGSNLEAEQGLVTAAFALKDYAAAAEACERILTLRPGDVRAWIDLGKIRLAQGDEERARTAWERALELDPAKGKEPGSVFPPQGKE
ncbi:MAG: tetratricopeptide repeat protein [Planctomycetota bacterium]